MIRSIAASALLALITLVAVPANANPTDDVRAGMMRFAELSSYRMSFGTGARTGTMDVVKPDNMHMQAQGMEMIRVNKTMYMKMGGTGRQSWMKIPDTKGSGPTQIADRVRELAKRANGVTATDLGMKTVDGESLHAYRMKQSDGTESTVYIARDGYVHRIEGKGNGRGSDNTIKFSMFNQVAPIHAPM